MKGILLAGGTGTRLYPLTTSISKQLLPVYDKPAIYYPLSTLMLAGIREILIISTPRDIPMIASLLGNGTDLGLNLEYAIQEKPRGIADAFIMGKSFIKDSPVCLILGDNLFYGTHLGDQLERSFEGDLGGANIFVYRVSDPENYGVIEFDRDGRVASLEEKPTRPRSNWAVTGLYMFDKEVSDIASSLVPSARGELEILDVVKQYLKQGNLRVQLLGRGTAWMDMGTPESLMSSGQFVQVIERRQGLKIACIEEVALYKKFINRDKFHELAARYPKCRYSEYLFQVYRERSDN